MKMQVSQVGIDLIKKWETLQLQSYLDAPSTSIWTIGYGHTQFAVQGQTITEVEADRLLKSDVDQVVTDLNYFLKDVVLTQNEFDALVSMTFNVGIGNLFVKYYNNGYPQGSTMYNLLLQGKITKAGEHITDFVKSGGQVLRGLVSRRKEEQNLYFKKKVCSCCGQLL